MRSRGHSAVEALVATSVLAVVVALSSSLFAGGTRAFSRETTAVELQGDLAGAKNVLLDDLSIAGYRPDGATAGPFVPPTTAERVAFVGDVDSDFASDRICYAVVAGVLQRSIQPASSACGSGPVQGIAAGLDALRLVYLDSARRPLAPEEAVAGGDARWVQVTLTLRSSARGGPVTRTITGEVALRNFDG